MIFGYARVSTSEQNTDLQRDALEGAGVDPKNIFEDRGISGATQATQRQGFSELMKRVQNGDGIVVWKLDRLGRSMADVVNIVLMFTKKNIILRSLQDGVNTSTPLGRALVGILASFSQLDRENISERVRAGMAAAKKRGVPLGRKRRATVETGHIVDMYLQQGLSYTKLAQQMNIGRATAWQAHKLFVEAEIGRTV